MHGGNTTKFLKLDKGAHQSDPMLAYLFILFIEILFNLTTENKDIPSLTFLNHTFLYIAYADDTTFFLKCFCYFFNLFWLET